MTIFFAFLMEHVEVICLFFKHQPLSETLQLCRMGCHFLLWITIKKISCLIQQMANNINAKNCPVMTSFFKDYYILKFW